MYEKLIRELRETSACFGELDSVSVMMLEAAEAIEELICEVATEHNERLDAEERHRWIPTTERLPEDFQNVLIVFQNGDMAVGFKMTVNTEETILLLWRTMNEEDYCTGCDTPPTHWMPLPTPPKEKTE